MSDSPTFPAVTVHPVSEIEKYAAWVLGMVVAVAVFFQTYVSLPGGVANLNLADPFAPPGTGGGEPAHAVCPAVTAMEN